MLLKNRQSYSITRLRPASAVGHHSSYHSHHQKDKLRLGYSVLRAYSSYLGYGDIGSLYHRRGVPASQTIGREHYTPLQLEDDDFPMADDSGWACDPTVWTLNEVYFCVCLFVSVGSLHASSRIVESSASMCLLLCVIITSPHPSPLGTTSLIRRRQFQLRSR